MTDLKRAVGRRMLILFIVGDIVGAGIYSLMGEVAGVAGGGLWLAFLLALALAGVTAMSYAELVTKYPLAAGTAVYVDRAFGKRFLTFMVAYGVMLNGLTAAGVNARAFGGENLHVFVQIPTPVAAVLFLVLLGAINFYGIGASAKVNAVITVVTVSALLVMMALGAAALLRGQGTPARALDFGTLHGSVLLATISGAALAFFAMLGFEDSVNLAEETRDPRRDYPVALLGGLALVAILYLGVAVVSVMLVDPAELAKAGDGALAHVVRASGTHIPAEIFNLVALLALFNTTLMQLIMASRLLYGMGEERVMPKVLATVHPRRRTPWVAIVLITVLAIVLVLTTDLSTLARTAVVIVLTLFAVVNVCVLVLRRHQVERNHFRTPTALPVVGLVGSLVFLSPLGGHPADAYARAALLVVIGAVLWLIDVLVLRATARS